MAQTVIAGPTSFRKSATCCSGVTCAAISVNEGTGGAGAGVASVGAAGVAGSAGDGIVSCSHPQEITNVSTETQIAILCEDAFGKNVVGLLIVIVLK